MRKIYTKIKTNKLLPLSFFILTLIFTGCTSIKDDIADSTSSSNCHPSYSGCLKADASDYDCAGGSGNGPYYTGKINVTGSDVFDLDRDNDGWGCE